jgi:hypothetical protein
MGDGRWRMGDVGCLIEDVDGRAGVKYRFIID